MTDAARTRTRAVTFSVLRTSKAKLIVIKEDADYGPAVTKPTTRGECVDGPRPCPFASCRHHLAVDVSPNFAGSLKVNFPDKDADEIPETCSLDVADRGGGVTLETIGGLMNITRERARQIEILGIKHLEENGSAESLRGLTAASDGRSLLAFAQDYALGALGPRHDDGDVA